MRLDVLKRHFGGLFGGFNGFLAQQQAVPTPTSCTLVQFDTQAPFEVLHAFAPIAEVKPLTHETYVPRASTPLHDAIGRGIIDLDGRLAALPAHSVAGRPGRGRPRSPQVHECSREHRSTAA